jgi:ubiquinone/menaquinone biosynthesis C-methylase UbiE
MHFNSKLLFIKYAKEYFTNNIKVLEIGPTGYPSYYSQLVGNKSIEWYSLDLGNKYLNGGDQSPFHIISEQEYNYPVESESFDIIVCGQVLEHVKDIWRWFDELRRIVKTNGYIITISPVSWPYHEAPVDCWRIYPEGMKALLQHKNLTPKVCTFESLEAEYLLRGSLTLPGKSTLNLDGKLTKKNNLLQFLHKIPVIKKLTAPITVSYDLISICQKQ